MKLFIAEKPSMARELAKCLPEPHQRGNGCIRTGGGISDTCFYTGFVTII